MHLYPGCVCVFFYVCKRVEERVFLGVLLFLKTATGLGSIVGLSRVPRSRLCIHPDLQIFGGQCMM